MAAFGSSDTAAGTGSAVVTKPSGLAAGDLMVAFVADRGSDFETGAPDTPSGWTEIVAITGDALGAITVYAKVASAGDAAAANFTFSHSNGAAVISAIMYRITGTFASTDCVYRKVSNVGTEPSSGVFRFATGFTPDVASSLLIMATLGHSGTNDFDASSASAYALETSSPTWTQRHDVNIFTSRFRFSSATATRTETTATGYYQITYTLAGSEDPSNAAGSLIAIDDTRNGSHSATVISTVASIPTPTPAGSAPVTIASPVGITSSMPSVTAAAGESLWTNTDKPSPGSISNSAKP